MTGNDTLVQYLKDNLFKSFAENRKILETAWERNKAAYEMIPGGAVSQKVGLGNKTSKKDRKDWRSKSVSDLTRVKTNAGKILVCDVLLADGRIPFRLKQQRVTDSLVDRILGMAGLTGSPGAPAEMPIPPTAEREIPPPEEESSPVPPEEAVPEEEMEEVPEEQISPEEAMPQEEEMPPPEEEAGGQDTAKNANFLMNELIQEQMIEAKADVALKRAVKDAAIYGEGISRIYSDRKRSKAFRNISGVWKEVEMESEVLKMRHVSVWDFFTDLEDHDIQENLGVFERRMMSRHDVFENFSDDGDNEFNIKGALDTLDEKINHSASEYDRSSGTKDNESPHKRAINSRKKNLEVLEFYGRVPQKYIAHLMKGKDSRQDEEKGNADVEIMAIIVEETLVRFSLIEPGMRPFVRIAWEEPSDSLRGTGVADACSAAQQSLDSAMRIIEDNKKITSNATIAKKSIYFANQHDTEGFYPGKEIEIDSSCDDVRKAIQPIVFPDVGSTAMDLVSIYRESGNEASMIPEISHGVAPSSTTTAYEVSVRNEKAGKYISDVVRGIDDNWIEPVAMYFYRWNMYNPEVPEEFKESFSVEPLGFASYNDRVLRMGNIKEILSICLSNQVLLEKANIGALLAEWMRANDLDPDEFMNGEGEQLPLMLQALQQQIGAKFQQLDQILAQIMQNLPAISGKSELDAAEQQAKIEKLKAETQKILESVPLEMEKEKTRRASIIAGIQQKNEELDQKGAINGLQYVGQ